MKDTFFTYLGAVLILVGVVTLLQIIFPLEVVIIVLLLMIFIKEEL